MILDRGITIEIDGNYIYGDIIEKIKISEAMDSISSEIPIGICDFTLKRKPNIEGLFDFGKFFSVYFDGKLKTFARVYSANIVDAKRFSVQAEDLFGVLEDEPYYGDIVYPTADETTDNRPIAGDVLRDIFNTANVKYEIDPLLENIKLNGELFKVTCREALMQVCFAIGAVAFCSGQDYVSIKKLDNSVTQTIEKNRIKENPKFTINTPTKYVSMDVNVGRTWNEANENTIFGFKDTVDVKAGEIRTYISENPIGKYQMKTTSSTGNVQNLGESSKNFAFIDSKPNKISVQFLNIYKNYTPTSNKYFSFDFDDETMTATVNLANTDSLLYEIIFPYTVNIDEKWYEVTAIGDCSLWTYSGAVKIPPTITTIKTNAFSNSDISEICIPISVTKIEQNAFSGLQKSILVSYEGSATDWAKIEFGSGNEIIQNEDIYFNSDRASLQRRPFGLVGYGYDDAVISTETKTNPFALNSPNSQEASINHATLVTYDYGKNVDSSVKSGNLTEVFDRVFEELTKTEEIECTIFEQRHVKEGDFVRYGQDTYGSVAYGCQRPPTITYDKPVNLGDVVGIEVNEYGYREKRITSQEYDFNGGIIAKKCKLK